MQFCIGHCSTGCDLQPNITLNLPVIMLEMMSGRMMSFSIRMRMSPGKPKYSLSRWDRDANSLTRTPKPIPERFTSEKPDQKEFLVSGEDMKLLKFHSVFHLDSLLFAFSISEPHMYSVFHSVILVLHCHLLSHIPDQY